MPWRTSWPPSAQGRLITVIWTSVFFLHALIYLLLIPAWQAPDEPTSFELLLTLQARNRLVKPADSSPEIQREIIASMERNRFWELGSYGGRPLNDDDKNFRTIWSCCHTQLNRPPLYQLLFVPVASLTVHWQIEPRLRLLRFLTILMSVITVAVVVRIAGELGEIHPAIPWIVPAFVALSPQFAYSSATFNADNLATLLGALLFWRLLGALRYGLTARAAVEFCLLIVLGFATKRTAFLAAPAVVFGLTWQTVVGLRGQTMQARRKSLLAIGGGVVTFCALFAVVPALRTLAGSLISEYLFNNDPQKHFSVFHQVTEQNLTTATWASRNLKFINLSFWGSYGWHTFEIAPLISYLLMIMIVMSWLSVVMWLMWSRRTLPGWCVRFLGACIVGGIAAVLLTVFGTPPEVMPQGRYLFPVLVPISLLTTLGICAWWPRQWLLFASALVAGLLALDLYAIFGVVIPAFLR